MIKTHLGAIRYNNKMDKIFREAKEAKKRVYNQACKIHEHLTKTNQGFCFLENGEIKTIEQCNTIITAYKLHNGIK